LDAWIYATHGLFGHKSGGYQLPTKAGLQHALFVAILYIPEDCPFIAQVKPMSFAVASQWVVVACGHGR
jgi:hypothetical protein